MLPTYIVWLIPSGEKPYVGHDLDKAVDCRDNKHSGERTCFTYVPADEPWATLMLASHEFRLGWYYATCVQ
jgi:hypothetical protein